MNVFGQIQRQERGDDDGSGIFRTISIDIVTCFGFSTPLSSVAMCKTSPSPGAMPQLPILYGALECRGRKKGRDISKSEFLADTPFIEDDLTMDCQHY